MYLNSVVYCILYIVAASKVINSQAIGNIKANSIESTATELHSSIIDASTGSNSLNEHLASIVKLDAPFAQNGVQPIPSSPETVQPIPNPPGEPSENSDLKTDASGYYGYGGYRPPYYPYYQYPPYGGYSYGSYNYPNYYPHYSYYRPYGYRNNYYSGNYFYNPYRRPFGSYYY